MLDVLLIIATFDNMHGGIRSIGPKTTNNLATNFVGQGSFTVNKDVQYLKSAESREL